MELKKKKLFWLAFLALAVLATDIYFDITKTQDSKALLQTHKMESVNSGTGTSGITKPAGTSALNPATSQSKDNSNQPTAEYLSTNPESENQKIDERAQSLNENQKTELQKKSMDTTLNQDLRFEAVFLLSRSPHSEDMLAEIALSTIPSSTKDRMLDFENILRAQAIEGLQNSKDKVKASLLLNEIINKSDNTFLISRSKRANNYLKNGGDSLETQDNKMLKATLDE